MQSCLELLPFARAVIRDGRLTLNTWVPGLVTGGPVRPLLDPLVASRVVLADLSLDDSDGARELLVEWVPEDTTGGDAGTVLEAWAAQVGYVRVWFPDRVVEVGHTLVGGGCARVRCPTCGLRWKDSSADFWANVRRQGAYPRRCRACNGPLPQWTAEESMTGDPPDAPWRARRDAPVRS